MTKDILPIHNNQTHTPINISVIILNLKYGQLMNEVLDYKR